jgi:hypothetical protein
MTDILIRDVSPDVVAALDARARRLGLPRTEYLTRLLVQAAIAPTRPTTQEDLERFDETFADLRNPEVMARAWGE